MGDKFKVVTQQPIETEHDIDAVAASLKQAQIDLRNAEACVINFQELLALGRLQGAKTSEERAAEAPAPEAPAPEAVEPTAV